MGLARSGSSPVADTIVQSSLFGEITDYAGTELITNGLFDFLGVRGSEPSTLVRSPQRAASSAER
jgi:hypothetical protein